MGRWRNSASPAATYQARTDDGLTLVDCRISNAVRCVPPENKPEPREVAACRPFLAAEIAAMPRLEAVLALGAIAHQAVLAALGEKRAPYPFAHGALHRLPRRTPRRQLPLLALQHQYRQSSPRRCSRPCSPSWNLVTRD